MQASTEREAKGDEIDNEYKAYSSA